MRLIDVKSMKTICYFPKNEAKRKFPSFCAGGWGNTITSQTEILDVEHIPKEK